VPLTPGKPDASADQSADALLAMPELTQLFQRMQVE
jgi:hypothetical protein